MSNIKTQKLFFYENSFIREIFLVSTAKKWSKNRLFLIQGKNAVLKLVDDERYQQLKAPKHFSMGKVLAAGSAEAITIYRQCDGLLGITEPLYESRVPNSTEVENVAGESCTNG